MPLIERIRLPDDDSVFGGNKVFDAFQYAPAVKYAGLMFIAGQVGLKADASVPDTAREQIECVFKRLSHILALEGLGFDRLLQITSYHVSIDAQLADFRDIKARYITTDFPAWTILGVSSLARSNLLVEVSAVAALR